MVVEDGLNLWVALEIVIKSKSNLSIFNGRFKADSVSPSGLFNTDIELCTNRQNKHINWT